ncbi:MAG: hypothetical protein AB1899_06180 [Pseudomonadota bacterium]
MSEILKLLASIRWITSLLVAWLLLGTMAGCATIETGRAPNDGINPYFTGVHSFDIERIPRMAMYIPVVLDSIPIEYGLRSQIREVKIYTTPGVHRIVYRAGFQTELGAPVIYAILVLEANLLAGHGYRINGRLDGDRVVSWLEDDRTGEVLPYRTQKKWQTVPDTIITPVILPGR